MYVFEIKKLKRITKQRQKAKSKVQIMFFEVKMKQAMYAWRFLGVEMHELRSTSHI